MSYQDDLLKIKLSLIDVDKRIEYLRCFRNSLFCNQNSIEYQCAKFRLYDLYKEKFNLVDKEMCIVSDLPIYEFRRYMIRQWRENDEF